MIRLALPIAVLLGSAFARAAPEGQGSEPARAAPSAVATSPALLDSALRALVGKGVTVRLSLRNGMAADGRVLSVDEWFVNLAAPPSTVLAIPRSDVADVRVIAFAAPREPERAAVARPDVVVLDRHFGINLSVPTGLSFDVDYRPFFGFANVSLLFPAITNGYWLPMSVGAGGSFQLAPNLRWKLETFVHYSPFMSGNDGWAHAVGFGLGAHYTSEGGFTFGIRTPLVGFWPWADGGKGEAGEMVARYFLLSAMGLPLLTIGHRF